MTRTKSMKEQLIAYLKEKVLGKILKTNDVTYLLDEGKLKDVYSNQIMFSYLQLTENGVHFNMTTIAKEKVYFLDKNGKCSGIKKDYTGISVFHYELAARKSTNEFTGYMRLISTTTVAPEMEAVVQGVYDVRIENNELKWKEQQLLYRDMPSTEGNFRSVAFDAEARFYIEEGKLRFEYIPFYYDVTPETMERKLSTS
ncbi:Uncharacterised protein [Bacteroides thetaiotaomicron]|nr:Uncharacterised protein [Bacteroides thetaiotaomicron]